MLARPQLDRLKTAQNTSLDVARLPTNTTTRSHSVHRWFNFIAGFSPELVDACMATVGEPHSSLRLLDPFSGCGTAPLAARLAGATSIAYEAHPFFAQISEAKANSPLYVGELKSIAAIISEAIVEAKSDLVSLSSSASTFLLKMFNLSDLIALVSARDALMARGFGGNPLAFLILSRMLDHCCFAATDGIYKAPTSPKAASSPTEALRRVMSLVSADIIQAEKNPASVEIIVKSSEVMSEVESASIDLVVTSPPYLNNFDFAEMTRMYLYFWNIAASWGEITEKVRGRLIVNTTTALKGHKHRQEYYRSTLPGGLIGEVSSVVASLEKQRSEKAGKKEYDYIVYPYLSQMQSVLKECHRALKPGASFHMMVSDAALYGVHIPAPQWLAEIMRQIGFRDIDCELVRLRGHRWVLEKREGSANGLGEYYVHGKAT